MHYRRAFTPGASLFFTVVTHEHRIRNEEDYARHVDYIHHNPVKHGWAKAAAEWPYSSFRRYVAAGIYPADWGHAAPDLEGVGRE